MAEAPVPLTPIAGGTDLMVSWHHRPKDDLALIDLSRIQELKSWTLAADHLELGGLTTYWELIRSPEVAAAFPLLVQAARQVGAVQIQTRGTWAGNIANGSPAADGVPVMMAYDARVVLVSRDQRVEVALDDYYTAYKQSRRRPDQLIQSIIMPRRPREFEWFHKVGARSAQAITKVGVAMVCDPAGWRVVVNSVAPTVCRCRHLEAALHAGTGFQSPEEVRRILQNDIAPIDDIRSTAVYRERVLSRLIHYRLAERAAD